jgi:hypothetical protein
MILRKGSATGHPSRLATLASVAFAVACVGPPDPVPCNAAPECPIVDEEATSDDVRVFWAADEGLVMTLGDSPSDIQVVGGEAVFTPDPADPDCLENCAITLKRLRVILDDMYLASSDDSVSIRDLEVAFGAPTVLENLDGAGSILPVGTVAQTCAKVQGILAVNVAALEDEGRIVARAVAEELTFDARVPLLIDASTAMGCRQFPLELSGSISGATPFEQNPTGTVPP